MGPTKKQELIEKVQSLEKVESLEFMEAHHSKNLQKVYKKMELMEKKMVEMEKTMKEWEEVRGFEQLVLKQFSKIDLKTFAKHCGLQMMRAPRTLKRRARRRRRKRTIQRSTPMRHQMFQNWAQQKFV